MSDKLFCSFCGKTSDEVAKLIAGPFANICNECTQLCIEIVEGKPPRDGFPLVRRRSGDAALAMVRLKAFTILDGWGTKNEKDDFCKWDFATRKVKAEELAAWAMGEDLIDIVSAITEDGAA